MQPDQSCRASVSRVARNVPPQQRAPSLVSSLFFAVTGTFVCCWAILLPNRHVVPVDLMEPQRDAALSEENLQTVYKSRWLFQRG